VYMHAVMHQSLLARSGSKRWIFEPVVRSQRSHE
jgi:hypothetical protein